MSPCSAAAGHRWQVLGALGHALQRRSRAMQVKEKAEHAMARNGVQAQLTCITKVALTSGYASSTKSSVQKR